MGRSNRENLAGQTFRMGAGLVASLFSDHTVVIDDGDAPAASRRIERYSSHHEAFSYQLSALGCWLAAISETTGLSAEG